MRRFVEDVLVHGRMETLAGYFDGDAYVQHNPQIADGLSGLAAALKAMAAQGLTLKYDRVHAVLGEGNFVLVVSEGHVRRPPDRLLRPVQGGGGRIAEHWDTIEAITARDHWKNDHGKFGF